MKIISFLLATAFCVVASAVPAMQYVSELTARDMPLGTIDCNYCTGMLDFCFQNGHTQGQEGCKQTCREHVCHRTPQCKKCHGEFDRCPDKSRYLN